MSEPVHDLSLPCGCPESFPLSSSWFIHMHMAVYNARQDDALGRRSACFVNTSSVLLLAMSYLITLADWSKSSGPLIATTVPFCTCTEAGRSSPPVNTLAPITTKLLLSAIVVRCVSERTKMNERTKTINTKNAKSNLQTTLNALAPLMCYIYFICITALHLFPLF